MSLLVEITALLSAGVFGGFISGMRECAEHKIRLPRSGRRIELGIVGDAVIGAAASVATYTVQLLPDSSTLQTIHISYSK